MGWSMQGFTSLTIPSGATTGKRVVIVDPVTGNAIEIYNASNVLVFSIDGDGIVTSMDPATDFVVRMFQGAIDFDTQAGIAFPGTISETFSPRTDLNITSGFTAVGDQASSIDLFGSTGAGTKDETVVGTQRGGVVGSFMQSDQTATDNLFHSAIYSVAVAGVAGQLTFNHNCGFTPTRGTFAPLTNMSQGNWADAFGTHGFTSTQARLTAFFQTGTAVGIGTTVTFYATFYG